MIPVKKGFRIDRGECKSNRRAADNGECDKEALLKALESSREQTSGKNSSPKVRDFLEYKVIHDYKDYNAIPR